MRLFHFFVVVAAAFLATGAVADSEPNHRNLRKHHDTLVDEERGIPKILNEENISIKRLNSLLKKMEQRKKAELAKLIKLYESSPTFGRIKPSNS
ncbi:hypothetical protein DVH05_000238 [Phytophthora capsici]|nr:hypothetical protein DVH05_000238 [Phytophthora capsici]